MQNIKTPVTKSHLTQLRRRSTQQLGHFNLTKSDLLFIGLFVAVVIYLLIKEPFLITILGCASVVFLSL
jgi:hypothetical protein